MNLFEINENDNIFKVEKKDIPGFKVVGSRRNAKTISKMACSRDVIVIGTVDNFISKWSPSMDPDSEYEPIELMRRSDESIDHIFIDPSGYHCIVTMTNGDNYYIFTRSQQPRCKKISRFQGNVESVAFDKNGGTETQTRSFLVATSIGYIYEVCLESSGKEKVNQQVFQLDQPLPITSLHFEYVGATGGDERYVGLLADAKIFVLCATSSPTRLYTFYGGPNFQQLFLDQVQRGPASYNDLPGDIKRAELHFYSDRNRGGSATGNNRQTFALMTDVGIYYGSAVFPSATSAKSDYSDVLAEWQLMPYVASMDADSEVASGSSVSAPLPLSIGVTAHHFLTLNAERLQALSKLNGELVWELDARRFTTTNPGTPVCLARDLYNNNIWMCTDCSVYQVISTNEDRNVWLIYLQRALAAAEDKLFDQAVENCKTSDQRLHVLCSQAEMYIEQGNHVAASKVLAKAGISFDEAALRLLGVTPSAREVSMRNSSQNSSGLRRSSRYGSSPASSSSSLANGGVGGAYVNGPALTALRVYLSETLAAQPAAAKSQRTMLATWLCEIFLHQITCAALFSVATSPSSSGVGSAITRVGMTSSGGVLQTEAELMALFKQFLRVYKTSLDQATTIHQIAGRSSMKCHRILLHFYAQIVGDYDRVLGQLLSDRRYSEAISLLDDAPIERVENLIIKFSPQLIEFEPEALVSLLLHKPRIKPTAVLPALLRYTSLLDRLHEDDLLQGVVGSREAGRLDVDFDGNITNFAIKYLSACVERMESSGAILQTAAGTSAHPEVAVYHSLAWMLAKYDNQEEQQLTEFLQAQCDRVTSGLPLMPGVDVDFILRQCKRYNRRRSSVLACLLMGQHQQAVDEALTVDINLAKSIASRAVDNDERKQLWRSVAQYTIQQDKGAKRALAILADSNGALRIEDLLPHLPDFTEIDQFKDQICKTLEDCSAHIEHLRLEMTELSDSAEGIVKELESMKKRGYASSIQQRCEYCADPLFSRQFYLFPCSHGMHSDCLLRRTHQHRHLEPAQLAAVRSLEDQLRSVAVRVKDSDKRAMAQQEALQSELDAYIAGDCPLCGNIMINSLACRLVGEQDEEEAKSWAL